jgi:hypothetical protein
LMVLDSNTYKSKVMDAPQVVFVSIFGSFHSSLRIL